MIVQTIMLIQISVHQVKYQDQCVKCNTVHYSTVQYSKPKSGHYNTEFLPGLSLSLGRAGSPAPPALNKRKPLLFLAPSRYSTVLYGTVRYGTMR